MTHSNIKNLSVLFSKVLWISNTSNSIVASIAEGEDIDINYCANQSGIWALIPKTRNPETFMRIFIGEDEQKAEKFLKDHWNSQELANRYGNGETEGLVSTGI